MLSICNEAKIETIKSKRMFVDHIFFKSILKVDRLKFGPSFTFQEFQQKFKFLLKISGIYNLHNIVYSRVHHKSFDQNKHKRIYCIWLKS